MWMLWLLLGCTTEEAPDDVSMQQVCSETCRTYLSCSTIVGTTQQECAERCTLAAQEDPDRCEVFPDVRPGCLEDLETLSCGQVPEEISPNCRICLTAGNDTDEEDGPGCGALGSCCEVLDDLSDRSLCDSVVGNGEDSTCSSLLATFQADGKC